jgi:hypothetical protein
MSSPGNAQREMLGSRPLTLWGNMLESLSHEIERLSALFYEREHRIGERLRNDTAHCMVSITPLHEEELTSVSPETAPGSARVQGRWTHLMLPRRLFLIALVLASGMIGYELGFLIPQARYWRELHHADQGEMRGGDFYAIWLTSRELRDNRRNPYDEFTTSALQRHLYGRTLGQRGPNELPVHYRAFSYPLFADLIVWPLAEMSFEHARLLLWILFLPLSALTAVLWMRTFGLVLPLAVTVGAVLLYGTSYGSLEALYAIQPTIIVAALLAATISALANGRYWSAGTWLALASIKPQLVVMLTPWLLLWGLSKWKSRRGLVLSFASIATIMMLASELLVPGWVNLWVRNLLEYRTYTFPPLFPFVMGRMGEVLAIVLVVATVYWAWRQRGVDPGDDFMLLVSLLLAVTVAVFPTAGAMYEDLVLWPGLVWIYIHRKEFLTTSQPRKWMLYVAIATLLWSYVAAGVLLAWAALGIPWNWSGMLAPIRLTASLPFVVIALLTLALFRHRSSPRLA